MAQTAAAVQTVLGDGNFFVPRIIMQFGGEGKGPYAVTDTLQHWLVNGGTSYNGRVVKIDTTAADSAADQGTAILAALLAGGGA